MKYPYSLEIACAVRACLEKDGWKYKFHRLVGVFEIRMNLKIEVQAGYCMLEVKENGVLIYGRSIFADEQNPEMMAQLSEYICRINYGIMNGAFECDFSHGYIRFRSYIDCEGSVPAEAAIRNSIHSVFERYEEFSYGFDLIIYKNFTAKEAYEDYEETQRLHAEYCVDNVEDLIKF